MNTDTNWVEAMIQSTPTELYQNFTSRMVKTVGFGAGPSFMAQYAHDFDPPTPFHEGLKHLEKYKTTLRICRLVFENGDTVFYWRHGFSRFEESEGK